MERMMSLATLGYHGMIAVVNGFMVAMIAVVIMPVLNMVGI